MATGQSITATSQDVDEEAMASKPGFHWSGTGRSSGQAGADDDSSQSDNEGNTPGSPGNKAPPPLQKRRRVTRACDECRRKKIKCDGKQPCTHCTVYSYDCTYDQPSNRRRNPAPQYIEAIENRLHRAEALLKSVMPDVDLNDPNVGAAGASGPHFPQPGYEKNAGGGLNGKSPTAVKTETISDAEKDAMLESMVESAGALDLDDKGHYDFYGHSSGLVFLRRLRQQFGDLMGEAEGHGEMFTRARQVPPVVDSPKSVDSPTMISVGEAIELPSKSVAEGLCEIALNDALALMRFIHIPTFNLMLNRIFDHPNESWGNEENRYLPLVFALMAVGSLFARNENSKLQIEGYEFAIESGYKYFKVARQLMDITDCRDLPSIQAVVCMIYFLQSSAKLSTCYSYIGIALHSAIRMGLHRHIPGPFNPIESEIRKRLFWQIRKLDVYVGALLGLPMMLSDDDIDQQEPLPVDDEYITLEGIKPMPEGHVSLMTAMNAHTNLVRILQKVNKEIYPLKGVRHNHGRAQTYSVSHAKIREIEHDLQEWMEKLDPGLKPGGNTTPELIRVQQLLRIAYAYTQLFLYRPFLHYTTNSPNRNTVDKRSFACAAACVSVSRNIIHIVGEMNRRGLLIGAYWFTMYTAFTAVITLVFFAIENPTNQSSTEIIKDAREGRDILTSLAKRSMAADRCAKTLEGLFESIDKMRRIGNVPASATKKRDRAVSPNPARITSMQSAPDVHAHNQVLDTKKNQQQQPQRASTFPDKNNFVKWNRTSSNAYSQSTTSPDHSSTASHNHNHHPNHIGYAHPHSPTNHEIRYTPPAEMLPGVMTPDSPSSNSTTTNHIPPFNNSFLNPQQQHMSIPSTGLPDLSPLMFPSGDPFAYPNQPMTALEQGQIDAKDFNLPGGMFPSPTQGGAQLHGQSQGPQGEAQLFAPMPPYLMGGQQQMGMGMAGLGGFQGDDLMDGWGGQGNGQGRDGEWGWVMGGDFGN